MLESLQEFTATVPVMWQWAAVMLMSAIPFVESYFGSVLGVITGVSPALAIGAAIIGNIVSMLIFVLSADTVRGNIKKRTGATTEQPSRRKQRFQSLFNKYGIAGVSLLGQTFLPSQITSAALVSMTGERNKVIAWQVVSIILWGAAFGVLANVGVITLAG